MAGKEKCEFLKEIRKNMAEANGIPYEPRECNFEGECSGTCPFCEKEAADLLAALKEKESKGEEIKKDEFSTLLLEKGCMEFDDAYKALVTEIELFKKKTETVGRIRCDDEYIERLKKEEEEIERVNREQMTPLMGDIPSPYDEKIRKEWEEERQRKNRENSFINKKLKPLIKWLKGTGLQGLIDEEI